LKKESSSAAVSLAGVEMTVVYDPTSVSLGSVLTTPPVASPMKTDLHVSVMLASKVRPSILNTDQFGDFAAQTQDFCDQIINTFCCGAVPFKLSDPSPLLRVIGLRVPKYDDTVMTIDTIDSKGNISTRRYNLAIFLIQDKHESLLCFLDKRIRLCT